MNVLKDVHLEHVPNGETLVQMPEKPKLNQLMLRNTLVSVLKALFRILVENV